MMAVHRESNELVFRLCMRVEAILPVDQISTAFLWPVWVTWDR